LNKGFTLFSTTAIINITINNCINQKGGGRMVEEMNNAEIMKNAMDDFKDIQEYMSLAKEENATKTYAKLKEQYLILKALLNSLGVNLTEIDRIKE